MFDALSRLVDRSLVVHDPVGGWYRLLETLRLYALDRCGDAGEVESTRDRHAGWWASWLAARRPDGPSDGDLDAIHLAYPNLRAALQWAATTQPELALELAGGLGIYWYLHGLLGDAVTLGDLALTRAEQGPLWARAVGRMAMPRYYANDTRYMAETMAEACAIADAVGDQLTPLRCQASRALIIDDLGEFRHLATLAESCGDLWVAGRMHVCLAAGELLEGDVAPVALERLTTITQQLDTSSFRVATANIAAAWLAADLQLRDAIARLEDALQDIEHSSPTSALTTFINLAWYSQLCAEPAPLERVIQLLARSPRDWGTNTGLALAAQRLPELLTGGVRWNGPDVAVHWFASGILWVLADLIGDDHVTLRPQASSATPGSLARFTGLVTSARAAFRGGRFRDAEQAIATLVRRPAEDRHYWLLMLARCAADTGSHLEAARLLGAVAGVQERFGMPWLPSLLVDRGGSGAARPRRPRQRRF